MDEEEKLSERLSNSVAEVRLLLDTMSSESRRQFVVRYMVFLENTVRSMKRIVDFVESESVSEKTTSGRVITGAPVSVTKLSNPEMFRAGPCMFLGDKVDSETKTCCGGKEKKVDVFECKNGVKNGRVVETDCLSCQLYTSRSEGNG